MARIWASLFFLFLFFFCHAESLFDQGSYHALTSDNRALQVGDKLTVLVRESTSAISTADTSTSRESEFAASVKYYSDAHSGGTHSGSGSAALSLERSAMGQGKTARGGKIAAEITVMILAVEPNGDVRVAGDKLVSVNDEKQFISVEGSVRRGDIASDNTIESNRLANVKIAIKGEGDLTASQRQGWLTKILDWLRIF
ncbi:flagellar basal body L-ring protein FlgH [Chitiniphilus shinanonensis]|nr:flagellar basal body L-ring protein FlgH [Chitiniphilus shinanonensis]